ncbi:MAG: hypothetical protein B7X07_04800 [Actinobacteria bacterium 21-64-8]|nr:MAG: hypothetical protein B7X07_04800 [Actinobacteria bacterium 21-64-8]
MVAGRTSALGDVGDAAAAVGGATAVVAGEVVGVAPVAWWFATTMPALSAMVAMTVNVHDAMPFKGCGTPLTLVSLHRRGKTDLRPVGEVL